MKRVVAIVVPVPPAESGSLASVSAAAAALQFKGSKLPPPEEQGTIRLEVTVPDALASKIVALMLDQMASEPVSDATLDDLLQRELAAAGPDACNLYSRIVSRIEERLLHQVYAECEGVKTRAADRLGINRNTLYKMLRHHHLETDEE